MISPGLLRGRQRTWLRCHPRTSDSLLALAVFLVVLVVPDPDRVDRVPLTAALVLLTAASSSVLVLRRDRPLLVLAFTVGGTVASTLLAGQRTIGPLAALIALYTLAVRGDRRSTRLAWAGTAASLTAADLLWVGELHPEVLPTLAWTLAAAALGDALGHRRAYLAALEDRAVRAEQNREQESRRQVAEERLRIARELHDVVAHNMAVVNVQAGVAAYLLPDQPEEAQQALGHVRRAAGQILDELGDILNVLRQGDEPSSPVQPAAGLDQLEDLVSTFAAAGLAVDWSLTGQPTALAGGVDLVAYRVLQEALTNAHKHGTGSASVLVSYLPREVQLQISNPMAARSPRAALAPQPATGGHGLVGIRERVTAVGGTVRLDIGCAGQVNSGGGDVGTRQFRVQAVLPLPAAPTSGTPPMLSVP